MSADPLTLRFSTTDDQLAFPAVEGGGLRGQALNRSLGLPAPAGANSYAQTTYVRPRGY
ncbi:hypothetical protein [Amycolatopsis taiwanensis]|uniref:hypothetical protein n=1 Tax=Amycolatopsis taiwanensis TaxID=342230 RepID=UPI0004AE5031|nr:hypothetical protein [Amycolatopsis taiwanensis]